MTSIAYAAFGAVNALRLDQVAWWLKHGPPLLLLIDLNTITPGRRKAVANQLIEFLDSIAHYQAGHRVILNYRSHSQDETLHTIQNSSAVPGQSRVDSRLFVRADLATLDARSAVGYLRNLRHLESLLENGSVNEVAIEREIRDFFGLVNRFATHEGSLISTPLLAYFVGRLGSERLSLVRSPTDIYDMVFDDYLTRESSLRGSTRPDEQSIRLVLSRLALLIFAQGSSRWNLNLDDPSQAIDELNALFRQPQATLDAYIPGGLDWIDPYWRETPYVTKDLETSFLDRRSGEGLGQYLLIRWTGTEIGFIHDSFLYYFVACAIRCPITTARKSPRNAIGATWCTSLTRWWGSNPKKWKETAIFLGGTLSNHSLRELVSMMVLSYSSQGNVEAIINLIVGGAWVDDRVLEALKMAIFQKSWLFEHSECVGQECYNYMRWCEKEQGECAEFAESLRKRMNETGRAWLRQTNRVTQSSSITLTEGVNSNGVGALQDGRVVASGEKGLLVWDGKTGMVDCVSDPCCYVHCLTVLSDGRVAYSGSEVGPGRKRENMVMVWDPITGKTTILPRPHRYTPSMIVEIKGYNQIVSVDDSEEVLLRNLSTQEVRECPRKMEWKYDSKTQLAFIEGKGIVVLRPNGEVFLWDLLRNRTTAIGPKTSKISRLMIPERWTVLAVRQLGCCNHGGS